MPHFSVTIDAYYISMSILLNIKISDFQKKKLGILYLTYLPTYLPTYIPTYLPTYLPTSLPTYLPDCFPYFKTNISMKQCINTILE